MKEEKLWVPGEKSDKRFQVRIFRDDEVTEVWYENVTHIFWTNKGTVLTICLPDEKRHAHWLAKESVTTIYLSRIHDDSRRGDRRSSRSDC